MENQNQKIKIYKLAFVDEFTCNGEVGDKTYIGLTTLPLKDFLKKQRRDHQDWLDGKVKGKGARKLIWKVFDADYAKGSNTTLSVLEKLPANTPKHEVLERLNYHINDCKECINSSKDEMTTEDKRKEKVKCECGSLIGKKDLQKHIESQKHIDLMKGKKSKTKSKLYHKCACGSYYLKSEKNKKAHEMTDKHEKYLKTIKTI